MIKQIQGRRLGRKVGHRVVVKSFPDLTTNDMKHYLMPTVDKSPQQIILHVGTNDLRDHTPTVAAENIVDLARKLKWNLTLKLSYRSWCQDQTMFQTML